jgi:hypothetical protein
MLQVLRSIQSMVRQRVRRTRSTLRGRISITRELCPYCFDYFNMSDTPFRCSTPMHCKSEVDPVLQVKWRDGSPKGKVIPAKGFARERICPECNGKTRNRLCPNCHQELPHTIGEFRNLIISVVGAKNSGKSCYLPVLIETLRRSIGPDLNFTIQTLNDDTANRYNRDYRDRLMTQKRLLTTTHSGLSNVDIRLPLVFRLTFYNEHDDGHRTPTNLVTLAFFDTAGEDMNSQDTMAYVNKYIFRSDGIILLLDPLQLDLVRDQLKSNLKIALPDRDTETSDIITRLDNLIHGGQNLSPEAQIRTPLAITLSKFDAVESLVDHHLNVTRSSTHINGFDAADFDTVNNEVQSLIDRWDGRYVLEQIKSGFSRHGFFAMSALGAAPDNNEVANIRPKRVADAFLWILHVHKLIKAKA